MPTERELIEAMSDEQRIALVYERTKAHFQKECREFGGGFIDGLIETKLINDVERGTSRREPLIGMLLAASKIYCAGAEGQARFELQAQDEHTQFGVQLTDAISDRAASISTMLEECTELESAYAGLLLGRRELNIHYLNDDGEFVDRADTRQLELFE